VTDASFILHRSPITNYLLQTCRRGRARKRRTIKWATLEQDRNHILWADRLDRTLNLVDMLTEVTIQVAIVITEVCPLKFAHSELGSETERTLANVGFRHKTLEGVSGDHETDLVRSGNP